MDVKKNSFRTRQRHKVEISSRAVKYERSLPEKWSDERSEVTHVDQEALTRVIEKCIGRTAQYGDFFILHEFAASVSLAHLEVIETPALVEALTEFLMSPVGRDDIQSVITVLQTIRDIWYLIPKTDEMNYVWLRFELVESVFDCLHATTNEISLLALESLCNFAAISRTACDYLVGKEIFAFLTKYLMRVVGYNDVAPAIALMQTLVDDGVSDDLYFEMRQSIPVFKYRLLRSSYPVIVKHAIRTLIPFLENPQGFKFAVGLELSEEIGNSVMSKRDPEFGYYAFRAVSMFTQKGYIHAFGRESFLASIPTFLVFHAETDVSSILYTAAMLASEYWEQMYEYGVHDHARKLLLTGCFENKVAASILLLEIIRAAHPHIKDYLGNSDCFDVFCTLLDAYTDSELCVFAQAMLTLLDLNFPLYQGRLHTALDKTELDKVIEQTQQKKTADLFTLLEQRFSEKE